MKLITLSAAKKWGDFKHILTKEYLYMKEDKGQIRTQPPEEFPFIDKDTWAEFIKQRCTSEFQEISERNSELAKQNKYPFRSSRKSYVRIEEELLREQGLDPTNSSLPRCELWMAGRQTYNGNFDGGVVNVVRNIGSLKERVSLGQISPEGREDILDHKCTVIPINAMARTGMAALSVALMAAVWTVATAQLSSSCTNVLVSMSPCLNYITGNSTTPSTGCCTQLASVVQSQPKCLCEVISDSGNGAGRAAASLGISINRTLALQLPSACNVHTPSISRCSGASSPSGSPSTPSTHSGTSPSSSTSSKSVPSVDTSKGHATKAGLALFFGLFLLAGPAWDLASAAI